MLVFHEEAHPKFRWYKQCLTIGSFPTFTHELTYSIFVMITMYWFPLIVIVYTYTSILAEMYRRSRDATSGKAYPLYFRTTKLTKMTKLTKLTESTLPDKIRRSSLGFLGRARVRTLKMTIIIVLVFLICWTPYYVMSFW